MAQLLLLKRNPDDQGDYLVLLHRRGRGIREGLQWGITGGAFDFDEQELLHKPSLPHHKRWEVYRRAALRESIEEFGGGCVSTGVLEVEHECNLSGIQYPNKEVAIQPHYFEKACIPPGLRKIVSCPHLSRGMLVPYGKDRYTAVTIYLMHDVNDEDYIRSWTPRAMPNFRFEIDEKYKNACYGYRWVSLSHIVSSPKNPVAGSSHGLCQFLFNLFTAQLEELYAKIKILEDYSKSPRDVCSFCCSFIDQEGYDIEAKECACALNLPFSDNLLHSQEEDRIKRVIVV